MFVKEREEVVKKTCCSISNAIREKGHYGYPSRSIVSATQNIRNLFKTGDTRQADHYARHGSQKLPQRCHANHRAATARTIAIPAYNESRLARGAAAPTKVLTGVDDGLAGVGVMTGAGVVDGLVVATGVLALDHSLQVEALEVATGVVEVDQTLQDEALVVATGVLTAGALHTLHDEETGDGVVTGTGVAELLHSDQVCGVVIAAGVVVVVVVVLHSDQVCGVVIAAGVVVVVVELDQTDHVCGAGGTVVVVVGAGGAGVVVQTDHV